MSKKMTDVKRVIKSTPQPPPPKLKKPKPAPPPPPPEPTTQAPKEQEPKERKDELVWESDEYLYYKKGGDWYWSLFIISVALAGGGILTKNFLFVILVLVGAFGVAIYGSRKPNKVTFVISARGVQVRDRLFPFETLQSFWIFYRTGELKELSFRTKKTLAGDLRLPLGDMNPNEVREFLIEILPEEAQEESLMDSIARYLRF